MADNLFKKTIEKIKDEDRFKPENIASIPCVELGNAGRPPTLSLPLPCPQGGVGRRRGTKPPCAPHAPPIRVADPLGTSRRPGPSRQLRIFKSVCVCIAERPLAGSSPDPNSRSLRRKGVLRLSCVCGLGDRNDALKLRTKRPKYPYSHLYFWRAKNIHTGGCKEAANGRTHPCRRQWRRIVIHSLPSPFQRSRSPSRPRTQTATRSAWASVAVGWERQPHAAHLAARRWRQRRTGGWEGGGPSNPRAAAALRGGGGGMGARSG